MNLTIFNSWQSDSPHNSKGIRAALREASNKLESEISGLHIKIDEATSNQVGSLHIPNAILNNISNSDFFVVDLTTVGTTFNKTKKIQNPNVLIELGYAVSQLGWDRIIILFNKDFGEFKDLPFDIEKRSCLDFKIISAEDKNGIGQLRENLIARFRQIIEANPERPSRMTEVLDKDRANDIKTIKMILVWMAPTEMDYLLEHGSGRVKKSLLTGAQKFDDFTDSLTFHVTDKALRKRLLELADKWSLFLESIPKSYTLEKDDYINNSLLKNGKRRTSQLTQYFIEDIDKAYVSLIKYVRKNYPEVEI
jgi:hypothetical protein